MKGILSKLKTAVLVILAAISFYGCNTKNETDDSPRPESSGPEGGFPDGIFVVEGENIIYAEQYEIKFPKEGGSVTKDFFCFADEIFYFETPEELENWISVQIAPDPIPAGYSTENKNHEGWVWTVTFSADANNTGKVRQMEMEVWSWYLLSFVNNVLFIQEY